MVSENETVADIVAEMVRESIIHFSIPTTDLRRHAERIEAALKREHSQSWHHREMEELILRHEKEVAELKKQTGNAAAIREALSDACFAMFNFLKTQSGGYDEMANALDKAKAALATQPRNCDVGTAEEQRARFHRFCENGQHTDKACCGGCPIVVSGMREKVGVSCELAWAQMPYDEGGEK